MAGNSVGLDALVFRLGKHDVTVGYRVEIEQVQVPSVLSLSPSVEHFKQIQKLHRRLSSLQKYTSTNQHMIQLFILIKSNVQKLSELSVHS